MKEISIQIGKLKQTLTDKFLASWETDLIDLKNKGEN